ncbi:tRNA pseudouridine 55 synthase [Campylobacter pinnipediorum subsp. caledonicus]|uniref:tRNA pseudouridine synthase B n=1 Tax=Campylobacter pinnipediorum subsp. caledonicus TaxID=1874362 RepID=A0A1S6U729_9BACT|nr:tRNA pseudouridine(55) synthase TruB [Campylobacter pinnipediorum]AQW85881.1 tRNA pseudouridine 55 synthase [Campylobacter pinnipediorum subsp. caledonicus]AQW87489.1 tRNA pseudouridine 55 synthase [Campylobacter pinnipediorum subsp. caledonicus]OPA72367.1 tRNA pseudouridine(55) synthase TruB [Campylobacter pinnipediorum subsp. caledonicus]
MNAIFVANKPYGLSSNHFLSRLKRKYKVKKAGFSGTLDPFATGVLVVAFGSYTRLFSYLNKTPKVYEATIWFGASSESGDNENISQVEKLRPFSPDVFEIVRKSLLGKVSYIPPKFSAKNINGVRAYKLARSGVEFELKSQEMEIFSCEILNYSHPFLTIRLKVDEGAYARSYAQLFAQKMGVSATLSALKRVSEGEFRFENERFLDPISILNLPKNEYFGDIDEVMDGKKLDLYKLKMQKNGKYLLEYDEFFSIIEIKDDEISYCLNKVKKC